MEAIVLKDKALSVLIILSAMMIPVAAGAEDAFPIAGLYTKDRVCKGDGTDPADVRVKLDKKSIDSSFGLCELSEHRRNGNTFSAVVSCKDPLGGFLVSGITFKLRPDKALDFSDQYETYSAVLYRCPDRGSNVAGVDRQ
jgi:hypothetical protein